MNRKRGFPKSATTNNLPGLPCTGGDTSTGGTAFCEEPEAVLLAWLAAARLGKTGAGTLLAQEAAPAAEFTITCKGRKKF